jgi:hypothetical protein
MIGRILLALALAPDDSLLRDPEAQAAFAAAQAAFEAKDYATASAELERAFMLEPKNDLLYPWAQAERNRGRCDSAIDLYEKFIDGGPSQRMIDAATQNIERCRAELAAATTPTPDAPAPVEEEPPPPRPVDDERPSSPPADGAEPTERPIGRDVVGGVLVGVGGAAVITGAVLLGISSKRAKAVGDAEDNEAYLDARDGATKLHRGGIAVLVTGGVLVTAGAIRYGLLARKRSRTNGDATARRGAAPMYIPGGAGVSFATRF